MLTFKANPQIKAIEKIILEQKFKRNGSRNIERIIKRDLGVKASHVTIDKHYKECMNGEVLNELIKGMRAKIARIDELERKLKRAQKVLNS